MMMKKKVVVGKSFIHRRKRKQLVGGWVGFFDKQNRWGCLEGCETTASTGFWFRV
jgi:hypothetical protein